MTYIMKGFSGFKSPLNNKETFGEKARRARSIRPIKGEHFEGQEKNSESTHLMSTYTGGKNNEKNYVAPKITNKTKSGNYQKQNFNQALKAGETFEFNSKHEADAFAKGNWKLKLASDLHKDIKKKG